MKRRNTFTVDERPDGKVFCRQTIYDVESFRDLGRNIKTWSSGRKNQASQRAATEEAAHAKRAKCADQDAGILRAAHIFWAEHSKRPSIRATAEAIASAVELRPNTIRRRLAEILTRSKKADPVRRK